MYNISPMATGLPAGAGRAGSVYGSEIVNDVGAAAQYDGPCPPAKVAPFSHHYVFTVYALDTALTLPATKNFPPNAETLLHALLAATANGDVLGTATISGDYSATP